MLLYAPVYLSSFCINECTYCGFRFDQSIERKHLSEDEAIVVFTVPFFGFDINTGLTLKGTVRWSNDLALFKARVPLGASLFLLSFAMACVIGGVMLAVRHPDSWAGVLIIVTLVLGLVVGATLLSLNLEKRRILLALETLRERLTRGARST